MPVDEVTTLTVPVHVCAENVVSHDYIRSRRFRLSIAGRAVRSGGKMPARRSRPATATAAGRFCRRPTCQST